MGERKMTARQELARLGPVESRILLIRGRKVMLDTDLAELYGVPTKVLNQAVKRNRRRFPDDFMFRLRAAEKAEVVTICDHLARLKFSPTLPYAFTEHGAVMLATVLNSPIAVQASVRVVRAFVRLRQLLSHHKPMAKRLEEFEARLDAHDGQIRELVIAFRQLMLPLDRPRRRIGFQPGGAKG